MVDSKIANREFWYELRAEFRRVPNGNNMYVDAHFSLLEDAPEFRHRRSWPPRAHLRLGFD